MSIFWIIFIELYCNISAIYFIITKMSDNTLTIWVISYYKFQVIIHPNYKHCYPTYHLIFLRHIIHSIGLKII